MAAIEPVTVDWLLDFINEFSPEARKAAGEQGAPYPDIWSQPAAPPRPSISEQELVAAAARLWRTFAGTDQERASALNGLIKSTALAPQIDVEGELHWTTACRSGRDRLLAVCAATILTMVTSVGWERLGICAGERCQDVYADMDGRGSRRYCSAKCLNRARVRAYRLRQSVPHKPSTSQTKARKPDRSSRVAK